LSPFSPQFSQRHLANQRDIASSLSEIPPIHAIALSIRLNSTS
jgi:hypothetical protein